MSGEIIPIGKYKGDEWEVVNQRDPEYAKWLCAQPWFREKFPMLVKQTINNFQTQEVETPEHNAFQAQFLDRSVQMALLKHPAVRAFRALKRNVRKQHIQPHIDWIRHYQENEAADRQKSWKDHIDGCIRMFDQTVQTLEQQSLVSSHYANHANLFEIMKILGLQFAWVDEEKQRLKVDFELAHPDVQKHWPKICEAINTTEAADHVRSWLDGTLKAKQSYLLPSEWKGFSYSKEIERHKAELREALKWRRVKITSVEFEKWNWDVVIEGNFGTLLIELKVTMSDDYPAVLRQITKRDFSKSGYQPVCLIREYTGVGATYEQVKQIFASRKVTLLREEG